MIARFFKSRFFRWILWLCVSILVFGWICFSWIERSTRFRQYDDAEKVPACHAAIVLGTSRYLATGVQNLYFTYRIDAAEKLYHARKVKKFILSGDNRVNEYNEPREMKKALMERGIPDSCLVLDYAGLRTFDSMVRCREIFGQDSVIVVSQQFHTARSLFIAGKTGLVAFGFNAQKVTTQRTVRMWIREFFSRIKCVLDLYVFHTKPRHLGEKIAI